MEETPIPTRLRPTHYQQKIFDFIENGSGDAIVNAVAGSGKTTTLVMASKLLKTSSALFCAFNSHIQKELENRLEGRMVCKTIHSMGFSCRYNQNY